MSYELNDFVILWSPKQDAFHIQTISDMLHTNREILINEQDGDFIVLAFAKSRADADVARDTFARSRKRVNA
ncbi:MAG: hypothetical protein PHQ60_11055 [Sideroxydans sp.]|nr:hypothetical protein [Sideroxydans sp.]